MKLGDKLRRFASTAKTEQDYDFVSNLEMLEGEVHENAFGSYYLVERCYDLNYCHGDISLNEACCIDSQQLAILAKDPAIVDFRIEEALFIDTETTGLAGGTGTYAFLIGLGFIRNNKFVVRQYFMSDYHQELAMLYEVYLIVSQFKTLVSFNGKSFDWPLLKTRFILARFAPIQKKKNHFDLLHAARRLWRNSLADCSLSSLENHVLGVKRVNDIPGSEVPQRYFDFIQIKDEQLLVDVFHHNLLDVLSLLTLLAKLDQVMRLSANELSQAGLCEAIAKLYSAKKDWLQAIKFYKKAIELDRTGNASLINLSNLALIYRRIGRWDLAEKIWLELVEENAHLDSCEELAKYYEHVCKDFGKAKKVARYGLALALKQEPAIGAAFEYRLNRLERKLRKTSES